MHGGLGCSNTIHPPLQMLDVPSAYLSQHDAYSDQYGSHGFLAHPGRLVNLEERCLGLGKHDAIDSAGDQQSAVTNMSNITSASGEVSGSSEDKDAIANGGGGAAGGIEQLPISKAATSFGLNGNGLTVAVKKRRNLPGTPDPDAEVIALSPKTLMATNRFVCEICSKGFQRDQNLQLHRRGHNLPWKLKQRSSQEVRKRVYICPEGSCVHHDPARALGDLTGIKKHFCRKHGEKKLKCDKCSKRYAVQSDWKAHLKTCGTREYRCGCGVLFSRRDSFITHRAFCDALAEEGVRAGTTGAAGMSVGGYGVHSPSSRTILSRLTGGGVNGVVDHPSAGGSILDDCFPSSTPGRPRLSLGLGRGPSDQAAGNRDYFGMDPFGNAMPSTLFAESFEEAKAGYPRSALSHVSDIAGILPFAYLGGDFSQGVHQAPFFNPMGTISDSAPTSGLPSVSSLLCQPHAASIAQTSATALLQKAAQMGATASDPSLRKGLGATCDPSPQNFAAPSCRPFAPHRSFFTAVPPPSSDSGLLHHRHPVFDDVRSNFAGIGSSAGDVFQMNCNSGLMHSEADSFHELMATMRAPSAISGPLTPFPVSQPKSAIAALFGMNSMGSENRNPNPILGPRTASRDEPFSIEAHGNYHPPSKFGMMGLGSNMTPKSEDGVTRDFLGVRSLESVFGSQEHGSEPGLTQSFSQKDISSTLHRFGMNSYGSSPRDGLM